VLLSTLILLARQALEKGDLVMAVSTSVSELNQLLAPYNGSVSEILTRKFSKKAKLVYIFLVLRCKHRRSCSPSKATIAKECNISISTVTRALATLVREGFIEKSERFRNDNGRSSNLYTLHADVKNHAKKTAAAAKKSAGRNEKK
jgi:predicted transcriptional regulator